MGAPYWLEEEAQPNEFGRLLKRLLKRHFAGPMDMDGPHAARALSA